MVNPERQESQLWVEIATAHDFVEINHDKVIEVGRDGYKATVAWNDVTKCIVINIRQAPTETVEPLPVP
jgi:hypothetical protein